MTTWPLVLNALAVAQASGIKNTTVNRGASMATVYRDLPRDAYTGVASLISRRIK